MARPLDEIVRLDRLWFWAHPERSHRCRWPDTRELELCDGDPGVPLVIAIRHLGRGHVLYQPVIFHGVLPNDERSAGILFALAARCRDAVPLMSEIDVLRLQRGRRPQTQKHGPLDVEDGISRGTSRSTNPALPSSHPASPVASPAPMTERACGRRTDRDTTPRSPGTLPSSLPA
jgi:hypothetical protein